MASNSVFSLVPGLVVAGMEGQVATERFVRSIAVCVLDEALPPDHDFDLDVALAAIGVFQRAALTTIAHLAALRACVEGRRDASRRLSDDACVLSSLRAFVASEADYLVFNARSSVVSDARFVRAVSGACTAPVGSDVVFDYKVSYMATAAGDRNYAMDSLLASHARMFTLRSSRNRLMQDFHLRRAELCAAVAGAAFRYQRTRPLAEFSGFVVGGSGDPLSPASATFVSGANPLAVGFDLSGVRYVYRTRRDVPAQSVDTRLTAVGHGWRMKAMASSATWVARTLLRVEVFQGPPVQLAVLGEADPRYDDAFVALRLGCAPPASDGVRGGHIVAHSRRKRARAAALSDAGSGGAPGSPFGSPREWGAASRGGSGAGSPLDWADDGGASLWA